MLHFLRQKLFIRKHNHYYSLRKFAKKNRDNYTYYSTYVEKNSKISTQEYIEQYLTKPLSTYFAKTKNPFTFNQTALDILVAKSPNRYWFYHLLHLAAKSMQSRKSNLYTVEDLRHALYVTQTSIGELNPNKWISKPDSLQYKECLIHGLLLINPEDNSVEINPILL